MLHGGVVGSDSSPVLGFSSVLVLVMLGHTGQALHRQGGDEEGGVGKVVVGGDTRVVVGDCGGLVGDDEVSGVSRVVGGADTVMSCGRGVVLLGALVGQMFPLSMKVTSARCTQFEPVWRKNCNVSVRLLDITGKHTVTRDSQEA